MALEVAVVQLRDHTRSRVICEAMARGIAANGDRPIRCWADDYRGRPEHRLAVFYGLEGRARELFADYRATPGFTAIYVDLGYWGRREGGRWTGYHKVCINSRHPTEYFQRRPHGAERFERFNVPVRPWRDAMGPGHILLAGMGDKGAEAEGYHAEEWERFAIAELRRATRRPIIYRPKPSWKGAKPIQGVLYSPRTQEVGDVMRGAFAVVTHHSNVAVDAILEGVPAICFGGVAVPMASQRFEEIERLPRREGRLQWAADIAWQQWSVAEMASGYCWGELKREGLVS